MKERGYIALLAVVFIVAFSLGFFLNQPQKFDSCKSAYYDLFIDELCVGKLEGYEQTELASGNIEYFDFDWSEYDSERKSLEGASGECRIQGENKFLATGERENLIDCFVDNVEIQDSFLNVKCGCFFG